MNRVQPVLGARTSKNTRRFSKIFHTTPLPCQSTYTLCLVKKILLVNEGLVMRCSWNAGESPLGHKIITKGNQAGKCGEDTCLTH